MIRFEWKRQDQGRHGIRWSLRHNGREIGSCFFLPGSRRYFASGAAHHGDDVQLLDYYAGTASAARRALERDWCRRSIGLFGEDDIDFVEIA